MLGFQRDTCLGKLTRVLDMQTIIECWDMIERGNEGRHQNMLGQQRTIFHKMWHKSKGGYSNSNIDYIYTNGCWNTINSFAFSTSTTHTTKTTTSVTATTTGRLVNNLSNRWPSKSRWWWWWHSEPQIKDSKQPTQQEIDSHRD